MWKPMNSVNITFMPGVLVIFGINFTNHESAEGEKGDSYFPPFIPLISAERRTVREVLPLLRRGGTLCAGVLSKSAAVGYCENSVKVS